MFGCRGSRRRQRGLLTAALAEQTKQLCEQSGSGYTEYFNGQA
jgi:hypothetical protein